MSKIFTTEGVLPQQIAEWKEKYKLSGGVFAFAINSTEEPLTRVKEGSKKGETEEYYETVTAYFRKPTIDEMGMVSDAKDKSKAVIAIYKECLLGGHPSFQFDVEDVTDEDIVKAAFKYFQQLLKTRTGEIKKL